MSGLLDLSIGLLVVFLLFSVVVSGINEWVAQAFGRRGDYLRLGMERLINDPAVFHRVLHHPLIGSLYQEQATQGKPPSYVDSKNFALAIADVLLARANASYTSQSSSNILSVAALQSAITSPALAASPIGIAIGPILEKAEGDLNRALAGVEAWFNCGMDRVEGWYKARTNKMIFIIGLGVAALCNVDTLEIYQALNRSAPLRSSLGTIAENMVASGKAGDISIADSGTTPLTAAEQESLRQLIRSLGPNSTTLPIGYACLNATGSSPQLAGPDRPPSATPSKASTWDECLKEFNATNANRSASAWLMKLVGWTLSALAGTLGASYWFALLTKAINIRGSGAKPLRTPDVSK